MDVSSLAKIHNCHLRFAFDVRVQTFRDIMMLNNTRMEYNDILG